ncbi:MAG: hypothetical protein LBE79_07445 [Tannerella sp.]|jgi:hypothetical protein|nr:hypothetical protein [Tannerella sp.]
MNRIITIFFLGAIVSSYFFSFEFSFLPSGLNTKMLLGFLGVLLVGLHCLRIKQLLCPVDLFGAAVIALIFSLICFFSAYYNLTDDYSYATYFVSFTTWLTGAYAVCVFLRAYHGKVTFQLLTYYLAGVCVAQCVLALMIDRIPALQMLVDTYISQGQEFFNEVGRLYGIGAALDSAGVRFSIVLLMIAFLLFKDPEIQTKKRSIMSLVFAFFIISIIGNMISRTTTVGMAMGLISMAYFMPVFKIKIKIGVIKTWSILLVITIIGIIIVTYFYNSDAQTYQLLRFAFEGFFNWMETGVWETDSTTKLNTEMWIWPTDTRSWIIGTGHFGSFIYSTDIGYCRFILYCGLIGFSVFAFFFIYNSYVFVKKIYAYRLFFLALCVLGFLLWLKVATDIFLIYALFYCMDTYQQATKYNVISQNDENNLLYSRNI